MQISGFKPGSQAPDPAAQAAGLGPGERLSICGKFGINGAGVWRELPAAQQQSTNVEFAAVGPNGRTMAGDAFAAHGPVPKQGAPQRSGSTKARGAAGSAAASGGAASAASLQAARKKALGL